MNEQPPSVPPRVFALPLLPKRPTTLMKMAGVILLILLLLIPLAMIRSVLQERLGRRNNAVAEIMSSWGREQSIAGPVLVVPYRRPVKSWREQPTADGRSQRVQVEESVLANAYFLPSTLDVTGEMKPAVLHRGIYEAVVYSGDVTLSGQFDRPDFAALKIDEDAVLWDDAVLVLSIPDLRGIKESLRVEWGADSFPLSPGNKLPGFTSGIHARVKGLREAGPTIPWRLNLALNGSGGISFAPVGSRNAVKLSSPWPNPSFRGAFLPSERRVTRDGFEAVWQVSYYGRDYGQQWTDRDAATGLTPASAEASMFGVSFLSGIDAYRNVERAIKYGALFLVLVFAAFFLFEILSSQRIHPFQYGLVGAAFCLFYLGLLSLSEFISFPLSYLAASGATTLMIWYYSVKVLRSGKRSLIIAALLVAIFVFLYIALQLQDYALLFGTAGLFVALATILFVTRNIDWYARDQA